MSNFGEMTAYVSKRLIDASNVAVSLDDVKQGINESIRHWKVRRFWFNEVDDATTLTAQNPDFPVPADFLVPAVKDGGFVVEYSNSRYPVRKISQQNYDWAYQGNGYGIPQFYTKNADLGWQCWPIPDKNYTLRRHYLKDYVDLVDDTDTNDFTDNASRMVSLWAVGCLLSELRQDDEHGDRFKKYAEDELDVLGIMNQKTNGSGTLTIHSNLMGY